MVQVMITNGGAHATDKWADHAVDCILALMIDGNPDDNSDASIAARQAKRDLRAPLFNAINAIYVTAQSGEKALPKHVKTPEQAHEHAYALNIENSTLDDALTKVTAVFATTPFAFHFTKPDAQAVLRSIVGQHMADVIHIERRYHHDRLVAAKGA